jgi:small-conductance mechanosensitive channel
MNEEKFIDPIFRVSLLVVAFIFCLSGLGIILPASWLESMLALTTVSWFSGKWRTPAFFK